LSKKNKKGLKLHLSIEKPQR